jgi:hypothetical protein
MSERHLLISRHGDAYLLEATHGADRVELGTFYSIEDARAAARGVRAWTQLNIADRSGVE